VPAKVSREHPRLRDQVGTARRSAHEAGGSQRARNSGRRLRAGRSLHVCRPENPAGSGCRQRKNS